MHYLITWGCFIFFNTEKLILLPKYNYKVLVSSQNLSISEVTEKPSLLNLEIKIHKMKTKHTNIILIIALIITLIGIITGKYLFVFLLIPLGFGWFKKKDKRD